MNELIPIQNKPMNARNTISIGLDTQTVFYQPRDYYTGQNIQVLSTNNLNREIALFLIPMIKIQLENLSWGGSGATLSRLKAKRILLPITENNSPDWDFMEQYSTNIIKSINTPKVRKIERTSIDLNSTKWKEFPIRSIVESITSGNDWESYNRPKGFSPFIGASAQNNGITDFVDFSTKTRYVGSNVIGINRNGNVGYAFYHPYEAYFSGDTRFIKLNEFSENKYINLFITTMIMKQKDKYAYGYKMGTKRLSAQKILLPVATDNKPNWQFMEDYIKSLSNSELI